MSLIERDNVKTEAGTQDFAFWAACAERRCRAGLARPSSPNRRDGPPHHPSLQKAFSQPLSLLCSLSLCFPLCDSSWWAPFFWLLPHIHPPGHFLFFFLCGFIPGGFFEHSELFPLSTLPPVSLVSLINYLGPVTPPNLQQMDPFLQSRAPFPTDARCLWEQCSENRMYVGRVAVD